MSDGAEWQIRLLGGFRQRGPWRLDRDINSITLVGGTDLDLGQAEFAKPEITLNVFSVVGGVHVTVPPGTNVRVVVQGFTLLGGRSIELTESLPADAPTLRIRAFNGVGGVKIRNR